MIDRDSFGEIEQTFVRRSTRHLCTFLIVVLGAGDLLIGIPVSVFENTEPIGNTVALAFLMPVFLWFVGAIRAVQTVVYERGVLVREWFVRYWVPWLAVTDIEAGPGVRILLSDGSALALTVGEGSLLNKSRANRYQHRIREQLEEVFERASDAGTGDASLIKREWALGLTRLFVWLALFLGMLGLTVALAK